MYKLLLCQRYLRTRYIALASIISVTLGVATMIVVNSVMAGFSTQMKERIHGILADVVCESVNLDGHPNPEELMARIRAVAGDNIEAMSPTVEVYGMLSFKYLGQWITRPIQLIGIDPESKAQVGTLVDNLENYQEVRDDDGKFVRAAARKRGEVPNWELIDEHMEYRRRRAEQQRIFDDTMMDSAHEVPLEEPAVNPHNPPPEEEAEINPAKTAKALQVLQAGAEQTVTAELPKPEVAAEAVTDAAHHDELVQGAEAGVNPFDQPGVPVTEAPVVAADPAALNPARVYLGAGLFRFPYKDADGKVRMVNMVLPGDDVTISTVNAGRPPKAVHFPATVVDVFKSGMSEYDSNLVFMNLAQLQEYRVMVDPSTGERSITTIQIRLKDFSKSKEVVEQLRAAFPPGHFTVRTWEQKQGPLLAAVSVETAILNVLLFLIIAVAGFGILAIFFMIVVEKTRDIGILKALGAHASGVMAIFLSYGLGLGIVGAGAGVVLGLLFVWRINDIEALLTKVTGIEVFDERIYYFPSIPTHVDVSMVIWVAVGAVFIAVLASILPARRASMLHPVQALRYE